jgi:hypothetical protein
VSSNCLPVSAAVFTRDWTRSWRSGKDRRRSVN